MRRAVVWLQAWAQDVNGATIVSLPGQPAQYTLLIRRDVAQAGPTGAVTVPMVVVDGRGEWETFAGLGRGV